MIDKSAGHSLPQIAREAAEKATDQWWDNHRTEVGSLHYVADAVAIAVLDYVRGLPSDDRFSMVSKKRITILLEQFSEPPQVGCAPLSSPEQVGVLVPALKCLAHGIEFACPKCQEDHSAALLPADQSAQASTGALPISDRLIRHVGCGTVDDMGCCEACAAIRERLAAGPKVDLDSPEVALVRALLRRVDESSQKRVAADLGVSPQYLCDVLKGRREISSQLAEKMGYRRIIRYSLIGSGIQSPNAERAQAPHRSEAQSNSSTNSASALSSEIQQQKAELLVAADNYAIAVSKGDNSAAKWSIVLDTLDQLLAVVSAQYAKEIAGLEFRNDSNIEIVKAYSDKINELEAEIFALRSGVEPSAAQPSDQAHPTTEAEEVCLGCGKPTAKRDCCPAGTGLRVRS